MAVPSALNPSSEAEGKQQSWWNAHFDQESSHLDVYIYGVVGWDNSSRGLIRQIKEHENLATITVHINTVGGFIGEGLGILNTLRKHKAQVTTEIDGYALSMGSIIMRAADAGRVRMASNALVMIHRAQGGNWGDAGDLRKEADILEKHEKALIAEYKRATNLGDDKIQEMLNAETWFTADEALEIGLIDEITDPVDIDDAENQIGNSVWENVNQSGLRNMPEQMKQRIEARLQPQQLRDMRPAAVPGGVAAGNAGGDLTNSKTPGDSNPPAAKAEPQEVDLDAVRAAWQKQEEDRRTAVAAVFEQFGGATGDYAETLSTALADMNCTEAKAREMLLDVMGKQSPGPVGTRVEITHDERDTQRDLMSNALQARSNVAKAKENNPFAYASLKDIAKACLEMSGFKTDGMHPLNMVGAAFAQTTSDFPVILERTISEAVLVSYRKKALTWKRFCKTGSVSDFRDHERLRLGSFGNLDKLNEAGEYKNKKIPDGEKESVKAGTKGNIIAITREAIINDDLGYFMSMAGMLGNAAGRTVEADVYALLKSNPKMADGYALFHAKHKNIMSGDDAGPMSEAILDAMRIAMASHKDISGHDELDIEPSLLMVPTAMQMTANKWMKSETLPGQDNPAVMNGVHGMAEVLATSRLSGKGYYLFADANDVPTMEVNFLYGEEEPFIDTSEGWRTDGTEMKVRLDFGVGVVDYRGAQYNPGE